MVPSLAIVSTPPRLRRDRWRVGTIGIWGGKMEYGDHHCRHCGTALEICVAVLGLMPIANDLIDRSLPSQEAPKAPLVAMVCVEFRLVQTIDYKAANDIFRDDYVYFSSESISWLEHARKYVGEMAQRFGLDGDSRHIEIASNDGYLLQYSQSLGIPTLGVEPCASVATVARDKGIDTRQAFFSQALAGQLVAEGWHADLVTANNVFAHVPDVNDFAAGIRTLLMPNGVATVEVQHLLRLMQRNQFDTIYHEHFSYYSLLSAKRVFEAAGLRVFDVDELPTHGGSVRFYLCRDDSSVQTLPSVARVLAEEIAYGLDRDEVYVGFSKQISQLKQDLVELLDRLKQDGKKILGYGAPAKGVILLNYCGISTGIIDFTVDKAPSKQNKILPGVGIPILHPKMLESEEPDYILVLAWNIADEIIARIRAAFPYQGAFIIPMPKPHIIQGVVSVAA